MDTGHNIVITEVENGWIIKFIPIGESNRHKIKVATDREQVLKMIANYFEIHIELDDEM